MDLNWIPIWLFFVVSNVVAWVIGWRVGNYKGLKDGANKVLNAWVDLENSAEYIRLGQEEKKK